MRMTIMCASQRNEHNRRKNIEWKTFYKAIRDARVPVV